LQRQQAEKELENLLSLTPNRLYLDRRRHRVWLARLFLFLGALTCIVHCDDERAQTAHLTAQNDLNTSNPRGTSTNGPHSCLKIDASCVRPVREWKYKVEAIPMVQTGISLS
jgi:hypothetical protein